MTVAFKFEPAASHVEIRLMTPQGALQADRWAVDAPAVLLPGVHLLRRLEAAGVAVIEGDVALVEHRAIAGLTATEGQTLSLPQVADAVAHLQTNGIVTQQGYRVDLSWKRPTGAAVLGASRTGSFLRIGDEWRRLPDALYGIAEAVDALNAVPAADAADRMTGLAALRELLPADPSQGFVHATGVLGAMTIAVAESFSLDLKGEGQSARLVPVLYGDEKRGEEPLLTPDMQQRFGEDQFNRFSEVRPAYPLGSNWYVVLSRPLRKALLEVRKAQSGTLARKRALLANPRAYLREALGGDAEETVVEGLFKETAAYSDRVRGLGLWAPRVVPWIKLKPSNWFGPDGQEDARPNAEAEETADGAEKAEAPGGIIIGDAKVALSPEEAESLRQRVEDAMGEEQPTVPLAVNGTTVNVPATYETLSALEGLRISRTPQADGPSVNKPDKLAVEVLVIETNEDGVGVSHDATPRSGPEPGIPTSLASTLKSHQEEGLDWLQKAWLHGSPGVLLADDMGLGKTIQALAFLAWLRQGMVAGKLKKSPILIVAPTGLLQNWKAEHDRHLAGVGLGRLVEAYSKGLAILKQRDPDGRLALSTDKLRQADWILTTYETLRDFDRDFGSVQFAALLFDEAQKIKTPGIRLTDAAKAMNADFRIAMTGTPVENRLSDLWCITDAIHPAALGDLKTFSATYEANTDTERLKALKRSLDKWQGGRPPLMLRRLKKDRLPGLPEPNEIITRAPMPPKQREAYERAIGLARSGRRDKKQGAVLKALHELRFCSLHPDRDVNLSDEEFIAASARLRLAFDALDKIAVAKERALIFLNDLDMQAHLAGLIQRRYKLPAPPMIINGTVAGRDRQSRVDRFQAGPDEFDAMILSPQAGGVGLTLTRANHVIHLARWWNPAVEDQCTGRALRIGQTKTVHIHIPMVVLGDGQASFDENLHALLERKRRLMNETLMPPEATEADLDTLLDNSL
jgi:superfamily II DNA or RNA helicase